MINAALDEDDEADEVEGGYATTVRMMMTEMMEELFRSDSKTCRLRRAVCLEILQSIYLLRLQRWGATKSRFSHPGSQVDIGRQPSSDFYSGRRARRRQVAERRLWILQRWVYLGSITKP